MDKDAAIRAFIKKRELFRLLTFISLGGLVLYGIIIPDFFPVITVGEYEKAYRISVMLWVATTFFSWEICIRQIVYLPHLPYSDTYSNTKKKNTTRKIRQTARAGPFARFLPVLRCEFP